MSDIQDVFEMTPLQAGMLFQSLYDPQDGSYVQQYWGRFDGDLDPDAFRAAWDQVIARHEMLRAQCHWEALDHPAFAIHDRAAAEWYQADWCDEPDPDATREAWLAADRQRGFAMDAVPLMRFALIRTGPRSHLFVWTFHHLLLDGWCGSLVVRDVLALYGRAPLGPAPAPFRAYIEWRAAQDQAEAETYWRRALDGLEGPTPLGIDRAETGQSGLYEHRFHLSAEGSAALVQAGRARRLTLASVMQGAWGLILARYAGQSDVTFGTVLAGRPADLPGAETMVGLFLNTVPVRLAVAEAVEAGAWLQDLQEAHRAREAHGHVALSQLQAWAGLAGSSPLFDSLLIVETYPESIEAAIARDGADLSLSATGLHERTNFPLVLKILPGEEITFSLTADTARIPAEALHALETHLRAVLSQFAETLERPLGEIEILPPQTRAALKALGQGPDVPITGTVLERLLARAPDGLALMLPEGQDWTHGALMARAGEIAARLISEGIGAGDVVAVCQDRTADLLASLIAIWRCGATYLPLDPIYPAERIAYILRDAEAALALVDGVGRGALGAAALPLVDVQHCSGTAPLPDRVDLSDLAYILYTSGSTGAPKGVPISHQALANFLASMERAPGLGPSDRLLAVTTVAFDIAALELFGPLVAGGVVVLAPTGAALDGPALARMIDACAITVKQATPAGWRVLRDSGWQGRAGLRILSGGEALDSALAVDLLRLGASLWNLYGPTETTIWSGALQVTPALLSGPKVPVGGALDNTSLSLRDGQGRLVPLGVPGELWIGGAGLSPGYLNRAELTADRFVQHGGARFYRTGDRMRQAADGSLEVLGRLDDQVKLRGYRIELGEIEKQLETLPPIAQAVVMVRGSGNDARLVAYLRLEAATLDQAGIRQALSERLPAYMVPSQFAMIEAFPLTPNGKIDRKALPDPALADPTLAPRPEPRLSGTPQQDVLAGIWADHLGVADVGPEDDFFALGGHSLLALRILSETRRILNVDLSLRDLFDGSGFAAFCAKVASAEGQAPLPQLVRAPTPALSAAQSRQWVLAQLDPNSSQYHLSLSLALRGPLDHQRLTRALQALSARHAILRSRFPALDGAPSVDILPDAPLDIRQDDLSQLGPEAQKAAQDQARAEEANSPFDLAQRPPWRVRLLRLSETAHLLIVTLHHILADEWSFGVMLKELTLLYEGTDSLTPLAAHYTDFAHWQSSLDLAPQRAYWARQLAQAPAAIRLPTDRARPAHRTGVAGRAPVELGLNDTLALEALARTSGASLYMCVMAAYALLLHRHSDETDIVIGMPVANRQMPETHGLIGLFVNTLAIRADLARAASFAALLEQMRDTILAAHAHQDLPFEQVIDLAAPPREEGVAPVVQAFFSMPNVPRAGKFGDGLHWQALPGAARQARFDLALELERTEDGLRGHFEYAADLFDDDRALLLAQRLERLLAGLADQAQDGLAEQPLLTQADQQLALPMVAYPASESPGPGHLLEDDPGAALLFDGRLRDHLAALAAHLGPKGPVTVAADAPPSARVVAQSLAQAWGQAAPVAPAPGGLRCGMLGDAGADILSVPEFPGAFLAEQGDLRAAPGVRALILGDHAGLLPPGQVGRLALAGAGLARGYAADPARTAAAFGPNPYGDPLETDPAETCLFLTPYHGRLLETGLFRLCPAPAAGPLLAGMPLDPAQIEAAFVADPAIAAAAVKMPAGARAPEQIEICLQVAPGQALPAAERLDALAQSLPQAARPQTYLWLPQLPLLADGTPDRAALYGARGSAGEAPQGPVERQLATLWADLLGADMPGRHQSFFALGGDSVAAIQLVSRAKAAGILLSPNDIFKHQSLRELARVAKVTEAAPAPLPPMPPLGDIDLEALSEMVSFAHE